jgi:hypothetical protein
MLMGGGGEGLEGLGLKAKAAAWIERIWSFMV